MIKKSLIILTIFFSLFIFSNVFGATQSVTSGSNWDNNGVSQADMKKKQTKIYNNLTDAQKTKLQNDLGLSAEQLKAALSDGKSGKITKAAQKMVDKNDISKTSFVIEVDKISPGNKKFKGNTAEEKAKNVLKVIIDNLMIAFGVLALLVMTIGGGYMIIYHGQDELLSRGKSIFNSGLLALVVALSAGMLVKLVAYLLY